MINPEDDVFVDLSVSCTKDDAVAKLLGWLKGSLHPTTIRLTEYGCSEDQLIHLSTLDDPLETQLRKLRDAARQEVIDASEADSSIEVLDEKHKNLTRVDKLILRAHCYKIELTEELNKGPHSKLKIDQEETEKTGQRHITLKSLNDWAKSTLSITILDHADLPSLSDVIQDDGDEDVPDDGNDYSGIKKGLTKTKAKHLYLTLSFLIEGLMDNASESKKYGSDSPNVDAISGFLAEMAGGRNVGGKDYKGQGPDAIKKRINQAFSVREHHETKVVKK
jgi:hypothetical protein